MDNQPSLTNQAQPIIQPQPQPVSKALSVTSLVTGIIAFLLGLVAVISIPLGITAIVTGILGVKKRAGKGMAITGIVVGSIGLIVGLVGSLLVFIAIPALQRNQKDTETRNNISEASSSIASYRSSHNGALPTQAEFAGLAPKQDSSIDSVHALIYTVGTNCSGETGAQLYSVSAELYTGSTYCVD
jgi:uncharacterized membrane protein